METDDDQAEDEGFSLSGIANKFLDNPEVQASIVGLLGSIFTPRMNQPQQRIAGTPGADQLQDAVNRLAQADPKITEHLQKLAAIAETQPAMFRTLIQMLEGM